MSHRQLIWTDLETTSLDMDTAQICEIAWAVTDSSCCYTTEEHSFLLRIDNDDPLIQPEAMAVNGYSARKDGQWHYHERDILEWWLDAARGKFLAGANVAKYDYAILRRRVLHYWPQEGPYGIASPRKIVDSVRCLDVGAVAHPLLVAKEVKGISLAGSLGEWAGLGPEPRPHTALQGVQRAIAVYKKLLERYGCAA